MHMATWHTVGTKKVSVNVTKIGPPVPPREESMSLPLIGLGVLAVIMMASKR